MRILPSAEGFNNFHLEAYAFTSETAKRFNTINIVLTFIYQSKRFHGFAFCENRTKYSTRNTGRNSGTLADLCKRLTLRVLRK